MAQNYLVTSICRPVGKGIDTQDISGLVYYDPSDKKFKEVPVSIAIEHIEGGISSYFIYENGIPMNLQIVVNIKGKYLRSDGLLHERDSLLDMHRCVCLMNK